MACVDRTLGALAIPLLGIGICVFLTGFGTSYWQGDNKGHSGLWKNCIEGQYETLCHDLSGDLLPGWLESTRACECLLIVTVAVGAGLQIVSLLLPSGRFRRTISVASATTLIVAAVFGTSGVAIFGAQVDWLLYDYSFYLTIIGTGLIGLAGTLAFVDMVRQMPNANRYV